VLQISLREGCQKILVSDCYHLLEKLVRAQKKGIYVDGKARNCVYFDIFSDFYCCTLVLFVNSAVTEPLFYSEFILRRVV